MISKTRFDKIDIIKGIGIILMVCGHCGAPFTGWLYMFHMPIFFIASGYCWNDNNAKDFSGTIKYIFRKIKSLYIPYVVINGTFALLQNFFVRINIYSDNPLFLESGMGARFGLIFEESLSATLVAIKSCVFLNASEQLGGATWFIGVLILISVLHCLLEFFINSVKLDKFRNYILIITAVIMLIFAEFIDNKMISLPLFPITHPFFAGYASYLMGVFLRQLDYHRAEFNILQNGIIAVTAGICIKILMQFGGIDSGLGVIQNPLYYTVTSFLGWFLLESIAMLVNGWLRTVLIYIGKNTLPIVFLHFLAFKSVSFAIILITGMEMFMLASFPVIVNLPWFMWIVYTFVGIILPLAANLIYKKIKLKLFN